MPPATNSGQTRAQKAKSSDSNEKFVAEMALVDLQDLRAREKAYYTQWRTKEDQLTALLVKIASLDLTTINYQQLIDLMSDALNLLGEVSERWSKLTQFFATLAGRAEIISNAMLPQLIEHFKEAGASELRPNERSWYFDSLKKATKGIKLQSYILFIMSRTYTDMSNKFLLPRLAGLAKLLSPKNDTMRIKMGKELDKASKKAQTEVQAYITKRHNAYVKAVRQLEIENTKLVTKLGGSSKENQAAIAEGKKRQQQVGWFT
ncbi:unnamed protein product [Rotaria sp. Silwood2]|nr:unnamed protein product [Rotaria sp. Silwood2]CAF4605302.1 unnamed protein product [Rotaria sp. Silwood2]CAF4609125.1 unnamed protein product [Rotaria sp. Silwood2]